MTNNNTTKVATFTFGLCAGRHDLPVSDYLLVDGDVTFPVNPVALRNKVAAKLNAVGVKPGSDLTVYVTGLTPATIAVMSVALANMHKLTFMHFDRDTNDWIPDPVLTDSMVASDHDVPAWLGAYPFG